MNLPDAKLLYNSLFRSRLTYGMAIFGGTSERNLNKLQVLQNRAIRCIFKANRFSDMHYLRIAANTLSVRQEVILSRINLAKNTIDNKNKFIRDILPIKQQNHERWTRSHNKRIIPLPKPKTTRQEKSVYYQLPLLWNNLSEHDQNIKPHLLTKKVTKQFISADIENTTH